MSIKRLCDWVDHLMEPREQLDGFAACPYAKTIKHEFEIIETPIQDISVENFDFELCVFVVEQHLPMSSLRDWAKMLDDRYPELVFLPDSYKHATYINGIRTNNEWYNLLLCQNKEKLFNARIALMKSKYYSFWDKEYLDEIFGEEFLSKFVFSNPDN